MRREAGADRVWVDADGVHCDVAGARLDSAWGCGLAETARLFHYCRPLLNESLNLYIRDGRHPVLDALRPSAGPARLLSALVLAVSFWKSVKEMN